MISRTRALASPGEQEIRGIHASNQEKQADRAKKDEQHVLGPSNGFLIKRDGINSPAFPGVLLFELKLEVPGSSDVGIALSGGDSRLESAAEGIRGSESQRILLDHFKSGSKNRHPQIHGVAVGQSLKVVAGMLHFRRHDAGDRICFPPLSVTVPRPTILRVRREAALATNAVRSTWPHAPALQPVHHWP